MAAGWHGERAAAAACLGRAADSQVSRIVRRALVWIFRCFQGRRDFPISSRTTGACAYLKTSPSLARRRAARSGCGLAAFRHARKE
eukprot:5444769-Pleurochrysis_carterae.AAC.1